eukprot:scaffold29809_cov34-Phaeocystis_antarctica.AAC.1
MAILLSVIHYLPGAAARRGDVRRDALVRRDHHTACKADHEVHPRPRGQRGAGEALAHQHEARHIQELSHAARGEHHNGARHGRALSQGGERTARVGRQPVRQAARGDAGGQDGGAGNALEAD